MPDSAYIFTSRFNIPKGTAAKFEHWCNTKHLPDLLHAGFLSAAAFRSVQGEPEYLHLFEIPGMDVFESPAFAAMCLCDPPCPESGCLAQRDPGRPGAQAMAAYFLDSSRAVYETFVMIDVGSAPTRSPGRLGDPLGSVRSPCIFTARMELDPSLEDEYLGWQERGVFPELAAVPGFLSGRIGRRVDNFAPDELHEHVAAEPAYVIMWELDSPAAYRDDNPRLAAARARPGAASMRAAVRRNLINLSVRIFPD